MKKIDLTGHVYGSWLVLRESNIKKSKKVYWECQCLKCGKISLCSGNNLRTGKTKSCGCQLSELRSREKLHDLSGLKFGLLTVIKRDKESETYGRSMWLCKCDCGNETIVAGEHLERSETTSCGCCKKSKGEQKISELLSLNKIPFMPHYYVNINGRKYYYDFFVNNKYFIEYDGIQHYKGWYRNPNNLASQQERDRIKTEYCINNDIPLIRIPYTKYNSLSINDLILKEQLNEQ